MVDLVLQYRTFMALIISGGMPYSPNISNIFSRLTESKALLKSTKIRAAVLLQYVISSIIRLKVKIWPNVDLPGRNRFGFCEELVQFLDVGD